MEKKKRTRERNREKEEEKNCFFSSSSCFCFGSFHFIFLDLCRDAASCNEKEALLRPLRFAKKCEMKIARERERERKAQQLRIRFDIENMNPFIAFSFLFDLLILLSQTTRNIKSLANH